LNLLAPDSGTVIQEMIETEEDAEQIEGQDMEKELDDDIEEKEAKERIEAV